MIQRWRFPQRAAGVGPIAVKLYNQPPIGGAEHRVAVIAHRLAEFGGQRFRLAPRPPLSVERTSMFFEALFWPASKMSPLGAMQPLGIVRL